MPYNVADAYRAAESALHARFGQDVDALDGRGHEALCADVVWIASIDDCDASEAVRRLAQRIAPALLAVYVRALTRPDKKLYRGGHLRAANDRPDIAISWPVIYPTCAAHASGNPR